MISRSIFRAAAHWWASFLRPEIPRKTTIGPWARLAPYDEILVKEEWMDQQKGLLPSSFKITEQQYRRFVDALTDCLANLKRTKLYYTEGETVRIEPSYRPSELRKMAPLAVINVASNLGINPLNEKNESIFPPSDMHLLGFGECGGQIHVNSEILVPPIGENPKAFEVTDECLKKAKTIQLRHGKILETYVKPGEPVTIINNVNGGVIPPEKYFIENPDGGYMGSFIDPCEDIDPKSLNVRSDISISEIERLGFQLTHFYKNSVENQLLPSLLYEGQPATLEKPTYFCSVPITGRYVKEKEGVFRCQTDDLLLVKVDELCTVGYGHLVRLAKPNDFILMNPHFLNETRAALLSKEDIRKRNHKIISRSHSSFAASRSSHSKANLSACVER